MEKYGLGYDAAIDFYIDRANAYKEKTGEYPRIYEAELPRNQHCKIIAVKEE